MTEAAAVSANELAGLAMFVGVDAADLAPLAAELEPVRAAPGDVLMRQGDPALSFLLIAEGIVKIRHTGPDGATAVADVPPGLIVGEIALLRNTSRTATVIATERLYAFKGRHRAFEAMLEIPDIAHRLVRTARQRLAAFLTPIPVRARDGTELFLRPVLPGDGVRVIKGRVWFSPDTLYRRFLSVRTPNEALLTYLSEVDYVDHFVWVATDGADGSIVGDARYVRGTDDPTCAEVAFTVADAYQGRGIGSLLFGALAIAAHVGGIHRFHAEVLSDNTPARTLLDRLAADWEHDEPGVVTTTVDVPDPNDLPLKMDCIKEIHGVARQVIHAFD
ncbi:GNAT family N-acetyltransferase [Mycobacterium sp.]|jgi:CRP-like cAMP-binding protein|uniref:GNAT family N-acetyltransferase n=1 Tax=Mycobacterium sp. TaxID=1785 RepID=UPI002D5BE68C|nr:GNAT family N-acetyltransferase [Mycobacterium sp.]HZA10098.1 GNAT family N-acetyltransferase [Mycobacterium sp.]